MRTGKTSLPVAFAGAIGAGCKVIEIQAGWRDRQDLLGHYNAFERKFYESEFLLALYRAGCPRYEQLPFIIVLDEMNLSHPEQYFAEFISKLEQPSRARQIELTTEAVEPAPRLFQEGRILPLPRNVWFVGTANHDETTKDFAPKTYDRAHIMELPRHPGEFDVRPMRDQEPMALETLENAFALAQKQYEALARSAYETITLACWRNAPAALWRRLGESSGKADTGLRPCCEGSWAAVSVKQSITLLRQSSSERSEVAMTIAPNMSENCGTRFSLA